MSREEPQINVRVSEELKAKIKSRAQQNGRSMNSEIVQILDNALSGPQVGGTVRVDFGENGVVEIDPNKPGSVINGLVELMNALQKQSDQKPA